MQMQSAFEHFNELRNTLKMTTGSANLDYLIDSIQQGQFYLFYGKNKAILQGLVHGFLVNCVLPIKEKHGFESMAVYMNNTDYYQQDKSNILSPEKIGVAAKCAGIEPKIVFKNIYFGIAYNEQHQLAISKQVSELIESKKEDIRLLVVNNITKFFKESKNKNHPCIIFLKLLLKQWQHDSCFFKFFKESKNKNHAAIVLKEVLGILCKVCSRNKVALVCTGDANLTSRGIIPRPIGGTFLKHTLNVIVHLREASLFHPLAFKVTLIKHQYVKSPRSVLVNTTKMGHMLLFDRC